MTDRIEKTVELKAPVERVWQALTDHREFGEWFRVKLDGPFVVGEVSTGRITYPGAEHMKWEATIESMDEPRYFAYRWPHPADPGNTDYTGEPTTLVEFHLEAVEQGTRLTVVESGFEAIPADRRARHMRDNEGGWDEQVRNIKAHVE